MSKFVIPVTDSFGNKVYFVTSPHKGQDAADGYESVLMWLEKNGFFVAKQEVEEEKPEKHCPTCGNLMTYKEGVSKTGKPWKGWFCSEKGHNPIWG